jgi:uncharacterized lipoprotein YajG
MKNIVRKLAFIFVISVVMAGCSKPEDLNARTPEQQKEFERLYDMGQTSDRKSKGF